MGRANLSAKPVARQVLDRESSAVEPVDRRENSRVGDGAWSDAANLSPEPDGGGAILHRERTGGRPPRAQTDDVVQHLTRGGVARFLGVNVSTVRRMEARGQLHPRIGVGGIRYFNMHEMFRLKTDQSRTIRNRAAEKRLTAFELFREGMDWREVAIRLRYDPYRVYRLWRLFGVREEG
jgi:hypothetical protein